MPEGTLSDTTTAVPEGYYAATDLASVDPDLNTGNIRSGTTVFGLAGDPNVVDTSSGDAVAGEILSGKTAWVDGVGNYGNRRLPCSSGANRADDLL